MPLSSERAIGYGRADMLQDVIPASCHRRRPGEPLWGMTGLTTTVAMTAALQQAVDGDEAALARIVAAYHAGLVGVACGILDLVGLIYFELVAGSDGSGRIGDVQGHGNFGLIFPSDSPTP
jgi:hypothetical protein